MHGPMDSSKKDSTSSWPRGKSPLLVKFAIETDAINNSATPAHIGRVLSLWERFGILVYPEPGDGALRETIEKLEATPRKHWKSAWAKIAKRNGKGYRYSSVTRETLDWSGIDTGEALADCSDRFEVALLEETRAAVLDIPDGESKRYGQVEGIRLWDIDVSKRFLDSESLSHKPISVGEATKDIWLQRFQRLATHCSQVVVVDRYAAHKANIDGILNLLTFLDRDARNCRVTVYSSIDPSGAGEKFIKDTIGAMVSKFSGHGVRSVSVFLFGSTDFSTHAHDRHIRFDTSVIRIGRGISTFVEPTVIESTDVDLIILQPGQREKKETDLERFGNSIYRLRFPDN